MWALSSVLSTVLVTVRFACTLIWQLICERIFCCLFFFVFPWKWKWHDFFQESILKIIKNINRSWIFDIFYSFFSHSFFPHFFLILCFLFLSWSFKLKGTSVHSLAQISTGAVTCSWMYPILLSFGEGGRLLRKLVARISSMACRISSGFRAITGQKSTDHIWLYLHSPRAMALTKLMERWKKKK